MNCKKGDLAIIIGAQCSCIEANIGAIVECVELYPCLVQQPDGSFIELPAWDIVSSARSLLMHHSTWSQLLLRGPTSWAFDKHLKPIRPENESEKDGLYYSLKDKRPDLIIYDDILTEAVK